MTKERTFIAIKPDGVQRGYVSEIIGRFEKKGIKQKIKKTILYANFFVKLKFLMLFSIY